MRYISTFEKMKMIWLLQFTVLFIGQGYCYAQAPVHSRNPIGYALIDGENPSNISDRRSAEEPSDKERKYLTYVKQVVFSYKPLLSLTETQEFILLSGLRSYNSPVAIKADRMHELVGERIKASLPHAKYLKWKDLKSYPEYSLYYLYE